MGTRSSDVSFAAGVVSRAESEELLTPAPVPAAMTATAADDEETLGPVDRTNVSSCSPSIARIVPAIKGSDASQTALASERDREMCSYCKHISQNKTQNRAQSAALARLPPLVASSTADALSVCLCE